MFATSTCFSRYTLPVLFLGYAGLANGSLLANVGSWSAAKPFTVAALMDGSAAAALDSAYKEQLPHRQHSIGLVGAGRYLAFREGRKGVVVGEEGWLFSREEFELPQQPHTYIASAADRIAEVRKHLAAQGSSLLVVPVPAKADINRKELGNETIGAQLEGRYRAFRDALTARQVAVADPRPDLLAAREDQQVFLQTDTHWTPAGAAVVADAVSRAAMQFEGDERFTIQETGTVHVQGDLTKFITQGNYSSLVGLEPEAVPVRVAKLDPVSETASVTDIFGTETEIPAVLVGTSYSANESWGFAEDLKASMRSDVLNVAEEGRGPVYPMRKYLASQALKDSPPRLVIWEFPIRYLAQASLWADAPESHAGEADPVRMPTSASATEDSL